MKKILAQYIPMADMIAKMFGEDCEVVIHDLDDPEHSVVYVANNRVTGRKLGDSFNQLVTQVMLSKDLKDGYVANYFFTAANGHLIRSSTMLVYDENGDIEGAVCINLDTCRVQTQIAYLQSFLPQNQENTGGTPAGEESMERMVMNLIDRILGGVDPSKMSRDSRIEKIRFMEAKGIFLMKGSVEQVAEKLGVNKVTVYSYLDEVRGKK